MEMALSTDIVSEICKNLFASFKSMQKLNTSDGLLLIAGAGQCTEPFENH